MNWHPPIPAGLVTNPAIHNLQYKTAILLLLYCYDDVRRDGRVAVNLKQAAVEIQEPYETVRRWWRELRSGPFFCEQIDRGHMGWDVKFSEEWVDWHILSNNFQRSPVNVKKGSIDPSINSERSPVNVDTSAYKVLITTDQAKSVREREDRDRTARTPAHEHPAVTAYREAFPAIRLNGKQQASISDLVGEGVERLECWQATVQDYELSPHWKPENIGNMRSRFEHKLREKNGKGHNSNGTSKRPIRQNPGGSSERTNWTIEAGDEGAV